MVNYILDPINFPKFAHELKDRIYDIEKKDEIENMETECKLWVKFCLSKDKVWGGVESIYAVAELEKVNIVIFTEHGEPHMLRNMYRYDRTICIAYRFPRNGYGDIIPGVCDVNSSTLYDVAQIFEEQPN